VKIAATKASTDSATTRIIAKIMRALTKLPIGISHATRAQSHHWSLLGHICDPKLKSALAQSPSSAHDPHLLTASSAELLNLLLWSADQLMRPTFRNLTGKHAWAAPKRSTATSGITNRLF